MGSVEVESVLELTEVPADELISKSLRTLIRDHFTCARVLRYSDRTRTLRGFKEDYRDPRGRIGMFFESTVLPVGKYNARVFETGGAVIRRRGEDRFEEAIYDIRFQKRKAPVWVEFPLVVGSRRLGKLVLDKFNYDTRTADWQEISLEEVAAATPHARFIASVLLRMDDRFEDEMALPECHRSILTALSAAKTPEELKWRLVESLPKFLADYVLSAFIRELDKNSDYLVLSQFVSGPHGTLFAPHKIPVRDGRYVTAVAFDTRQQNAAQMTWWDERTQRRRYPKSKLTGCQQEYIERHRANCSVPIAYDKRFYGVLAIQGTDRLLDQAVLELIEEVVRVAGLLLYHLQERRVSEMLRWFKHESTRPLVVLRDQYLDLIRQLADGSASPLDRSTVPDEIGRLIGFILASFDAYAFLAGAKFSWTPASEPVKPLLDHVLEVVGWNAHSARLEGRVLPADDVQFDLDRQKLVAVLYNLVENAARATDKVHSPKVEVVAQVRGDDLLVEVSDNGCGVPAENRERIWTDGFTTTEGRMGSGLSIVQAYVRLAGGQVTLEPLIQGSKFVCRIPSTQPVEVGVVQ